MRHSARAHLFNKRFQRTYACAISTIAFTRKDVTIVFADGDRDAASARVCSVLMTSPRAAAQQPCVRNHSVFKYSITAIRSASPR